MDGASDASHSTHIMGFELPQKRWFTLREACELKGLAYKTACNRTRLQPLHGEPEARIGGRKSWRYETIAEWIELADDSIEGGDQ